MKYSSQLKSTLDSISLIVSRYKHRYVTVEHLLRAILDSEFADDICGAFQINRNKLIKEVDKQLETFDTTNDPNNCVISKSLQDLFDECQEFLINSQKSTLDIGDVFLYILEAEQTWAQYILLSNGFDKLSVMQYLSEIEDDNPETDEEQGSRNKKKKKKRGDSDIDFTVNMTAEAKLGKYDKLVGRQEEITRTIEVLCRRQKNNPIHVGESGVGKTAITEGLATLIAEGNVPDKLKGYEIYSLDVGSMVAGTEFRGMFEKRLKSTLKAIIAKGKAILYIDEIHSVIGAGDVSGMLDLGGMLKPYLSRGQIRCIGATTYDDYKTKFQKDKALARRFQKIDVVESTADETIVILQGLRPKYEEFHNVKYSDEILKYIVESTGKYLTERHFPDKAIDIMDELGSHIGLYHPDQQEIKKDDVDSLISRIAKIPQTQMNEDDMSVMANLEDMIKKDIYGQNDAIDKVVNAIKCHRVGLGNPDKPIGSFLFIGPTGVGKTELCRVLSNVLHIPLIRYDMSEFMEKHTISRLLGAPPGYVGFEQGTSLTDMIRKSPHSILLLDEIEKAHPDIFNSLLQIMDYATITDSTGRKADFRNVLIIMTSNVGSAEMSSVKLGFNNADSDGGKLAGDPFEAVKNTFSPEFRNRLDDTILFNRLEKHSVQKIARKYLAQLQNQLSAKSVVLNVDDEVVDYFAEKGYEPSFGARPMSRLIQTKIRNKLTNIILEHGGHLEQVRVSLSDGEIVFSC